MTRWPENVRAVMSMRGFSAPSQMSSALPAKSKFLSVISYQFISHKIKILISYNQSYKLSVSGKPGATGYDSPVGVPKCPLKE